MLAPEGSHSHAPVHRCSPWSRTPQPSALLGSRGLPRGPLAAPWLLLVPALSHVCSSLRGRSSG